MKNCSYYNHRDKCGCGIDLAVIPASVGDDSKKSPAAPRNGQYQDTVVKYEASGNTYIYAHDGTYSKMTERAPVLSVNGLTGKVVLDAAAVGALPDTTVIPTKTSELLNDSNFVNRASLANVSFTGLYDDLIGYPTALSQFNNDTNFVTLTQVNSAVGDETTARQAADVNLQSQIDAITVSSDVTDIVGTKADLNSYDTSKLNDNDIIKVLQDESQNGETTYYRWSKQSRTFTLIGEEGPYYTKSETDTLLNAKQNSLTAGTGVDITNNTVSVDTSVIQEKLTAGNNVAISNDNVISATDTTYTAGTNITISNNEISATDTTYSNFVGTDGTAAGSAGLVPAPATTDAGKFLKADGTWDTAGGGGPTVVQTTGTSTTDVMSQNAATKLVFSKGDTTTASINIGLGNMNSLGGSVDFKPITIGVKAKADRKYNSIAIGSASDGLNPSASATGEATIAVGSLNTRASGISSVAIGTEANVSGNYSVGIGGNSSTSRHSTVSVGNGTANTDYGTRYIANVRDPAQAQDAATKKYVDTKAIGTSETLIIADTDWSALSSSSPYDYSATVTVTTTISASSTVELVNDQAVLFGTHGFAIGSVDTSNNTVDIYSIGAPSSSVSLTIKVRS